MNEYETKSELNLQYTCGICLLSNSYVRPMNNVEINCYQSFVALKNTDMPKFVCSICGHLLKKFSRFINQCLKACEVLDHFQDLPYKPYHNFSTTPITYDYVGTVDGSLSKEEINILNESDHTYSDEDVPLVMFKNDDNETQTTERYSDTDKKEKSKKRKTLEKTKKEIRDGFSSRMVQETDEYTVIKLSVEEVIQEMISKRNSDKYRRALYKCEPCAKGFNFEEVLRTHMEKHSEETGPLKCNICTQYCPTKVSLRGHMKSHTTRYKCKVCGDVRLSRQHLLEHYAISHTSHATEYTCEQCYFSTNKRTVMQRHVKTHKRNERHACHECGRLFQNIESLRVHTTRHDKSKSLQCSQCPRRFIYPSLLAKHIQSVHERADYYCVECDVRFKSPENLRLHLKKAKKHRDASSYTHNCPQCPEKFVSAASLSGHLTAIHGEPKSYSCEICSKLYSSRESLKGHVRRVHGERQGTAEVCLICNKSFSRKSVLAVHMRSHTGERPFTCECGAAFTQHNALRAHHAAKHSDTW